MPHGDPLRHTTRPDAGDRGGTAGARQLEPGTVSRFATDVASYPMWSAELPCLKPGTEFKFIILSSSGEATWEPFEQNREWPTEAGSVVRGQFGQAGIVSV